MREGEKEDKTKYLELLNDSLHRNHPINWERVSAIHERFCEITGQKSVTFLSLDLPYSTDMAMNKLIATNLAAKKAGKYKGRKTVLTKKLIAEVKDLKETKNLSLTQNHNLENS